MPMDIRTFFAKKGEASPAKAKPSDVKENQSSSKKRTSSKVSRKTTPLSPIDEAGPKKPKFKRKVVLESDSDSENDRVAKKPVKEDSGSETEGEVEVAPPKEVVPPKKKAAFEFKPEGLKEVSAEEYFASANRRVSARQSKPKGSYVLGDSDDDEAEPYDTDKNIEDDHDKDAEDIMDAEDEKPADRKLPSPKVAKSPPRKPSRKPSPLKIHKLVHEEEDDDDVDLDDDNQNNDDSGHKDPPPPTKIKRRVQSFPASASSETPPSTKKHKKQAEKPPPPKKEPLIEPTLELDSFDADQAICECMTGTTFVFSGIMDGLGRDDANDFVKTLGGRVTTAVSGKTSYLVVGEIMENGKPYTEGMKYKKAVSLGSVKIVMGEKQLYGLAKLYNDRAKAHQPAVDKGSQKHPATAKGAPSAQLESPVRKPVVNPYAKKTVVNPYAKKQPVGSNPYAKSNKPVANLKDDSAYVVDSKFGVNDLWVDKYAPANTQDILGNKDQVTKLTTWLATWERKFNNEKAIGKAFSSPQGPWKAALLSGPPGIGKTTTATLVAREAGRDVLEFNASDVRSKKVMSECFGDIVGSQSITGHFQKAGSKAVKSSLRKKLRCLIFDEVDGMSAGDRGGMAELIQMIKKSRVPIICICNDRQSQKMKSLLPYCFDLRFRRPVKSQIAKAGISIAEKEGLKVEQNAAEAIAESCGNDIRQVINCLQMWASEKKENTMTYKGLKEREHAINKDEILRVSLFDAAKLILEGRKGLKGGDADAERVSFFKRNDAFFTDYSFTGLIVQQNYLKVLNPQFMELKRKDEDDLALDFLDRVHTAAQTMSDYAVVENKIRGGSDMNWSLLPFSGTLVVKTGFHASGPTGSFYPGFPEFTTWLGRNSSKGKKNRILQELNHHMNYKISGGTQEVRLSYIPFFRQRFYAQLKDSQDADRNTVAIELMDDYGLDRDDVFENLDEFKMIPATDKLGDMLDSKEKAAFTREYNKKSHMSQALVEEQGAPRKKRSAGGDGPDLEDPDAINDDNVEDEEEEDEEDIEKIRAAFQKKGRNATAAKTAAARPAKRRAKGQKK